MKKSSVRWAMKQWQIVERLSIERRANEAMATAMEAALSRPRLLYIAPVDDSDRILYEEIERVRPVHSGLAFAGSYRIEYTNFSFSSTCTVTGLALLLDHEVVLTRELHGPVFLSSGVELQLALDISYGSSREHEQVKAMLGLL